jgi:hypothetical protein
MLIFSLLTEEEMPHDFHLVLVITILVIEIFL